MISRLKKYQSINTRLKLLSVFSALLLLLAAASLFVFLSRVQNDIDLLVGQRFDEVLVNSQNRADFGLIHARLSAFRASFFDNERLVKTEGRTLETLIDQLAHRVTDGEQKDLLYRLRDEFTVFLNRAVWINASNGLRRWQEEDLSELLMFHSELQMSEEYRTNVEKRDGEFWEAFAGLRILRLGFDKMSRLLAVENRLQLLSGSSEMALPVILEAEQLSVVARQMVAETPAVALIKRDLLTRLDYMIYLLQQYQLAMFRLGEQNHTLDQLTERILTAMLILDQRNSATVAEAREEIGVALYAAFAGGLGIFILLAGVLLFGHRQLFRRHVAVPMETVGRRLQSFQQGDHSTPMQLGRSDEWGRIESVFNDMLFSLEQSIASLRDSEQRYREIFNNATEGIFRATLDNQFLALNPAAVAMLGHASEEEALEYYHDFSSQIYCCQEDRQRLRFELFEQGSNVNAEVQAKRKDGKIFWATLNSHLMFGKTGEPLYIEGTFKDISIRKAAEERLIELKNYLQTIIDSMPSVLIGIDSDLNITLWNRRAEQECQLTAEQTGGLALQKALCLVDYDLCLPVIRKALVDQKSTRLAKMEGLFAAPGDQKRYFDLLVFPLPQEVDAGAVIHLDDVTERVGLEEMLIQKEKMESIAGLAAGFAHELNNPLAVILQSVQVMERRLATDLDKNCATAEELGTTMPVISAYLQRKKCDTMLRSIAEAGIRAAKLVENIQTFSRRTGSDFTRHSLEELIERTLELAVSDYDMRRHLNYQRIKIVRDFAPVAQVVCDAGQIQQVLLILLKNAAQALCPEVDNPEILLRTRALDGVASLQVQDNGVGMSVDVCRRVFDPFYSTQEVGHGTGLGLSIAYTIVTQNHRGRMTVTSEPGRGSCFEMCLPTISGT